MEVDLNFQNKLNPSITGDFQGTDYWPLKKFADDASTKYIGLVIHVGDYTSMVRVRALLTMNRIRIVQESMLFGLRWK